MPRQKTIFISDDGVEFDTEQDAMDHEASKGIRAKKVAHIFRRLNNPNRPNGSVDFVNGYKEALRWVLNLD